MNLGEIRIRYRIPDDGSEPIVSTTWRGELPVVVLLGMLDYARDSIIRAGIDDDIIDPDDDPDDGFEP